MRQLYLRQGQGKVEEALYLFNDVLYRGLNLCFNAVEHGGYFRLYPVKYGAYRNAVPHVGGFFFNCVPSADDCISSALETRFIYKLIEVSEGFIVIVCPADGTPFTYLGKSGGKNRGIF